MRRGIVWPCPSRGDAGGAEPPGGRAAFRDRPGHGCERERLVRTGARLVRHARYAVFQLAESAQPRKVFADVLGLTNGLRDPPAETANA